MPNTFFASDHHLGHQGIIEFFHRDGSRLRTFDTVEDMNEHIIKQHNSVVGPKDTCWFLGDVVINRRHLKLIERFNGRKRLVQGNHDIFKNKDYYAAGFEDLHAFRKFEGFVATHIPVHRESLRKSWAKNVHGHLHADRVRLAKGVCEWTGELLYHDIVDDDYINVCMEHLDDYKPISIDELRENL